MSGNAVDVEGERNRVAGRDYIELNVAPGLAQKEPLVSAQRKRLKVTVEEVSQECKAAEFILWREIHAQLGVESVNEITRDQFQNALDVLESYRQEHRDQRARHDLTNQIQCAIFAKNVLPEVARFCTREFGHDNLDLLERGDLQRTLAFVDDYIAPTPIVSAPVRMPLRKLIISHPLQAFVLVAIGVFIGYVLF